ncbi:MAG: hypothetical protein FJZ58_05970 [Chlamydiae bacterium]|nr:hypothetical protein [Chlamydiota bacterium]
MKKTILFLFLYAAVVLLGGIVGYIRAGSFVSLLLGLIFGSLVMMSAFLARFRPFLGYLVALIFALLLQGVFTWRFAKTLQFFPSGFLGFLTLALLSVLAFKLQQIRRDAA